VAVDGWTKQSNMRALDFALRFEDPASRPHLHDIDRDGAMGGVNVDATITLAQHLTTPSSPRRRELARRSAASSGPPRSTASSAPSSAARFMTTRDSARCHPRALKGE